MPRGYVRTEIGPTLPEMQWHILVVRDVHEAVWDICQPGSFRPQLARLSAGEGYDHWSEVRDSEAIPGRLSG